MEQVNLLGCPVARCLGNAAEPAECTVDAVPGGYGEMSPASEFRAGNYLEP
jgi:hypothetical protein